MINQMAIDDIEQMISEGLNPTPRDIIKLNALACRFEAAKAINAGSTSYTFHRVAYLNEITFLREPTVGHEIWLKKARRWIDENDIESLIAIDAYCLSRQSCNLCDADDKNIVYTDIDNFLKSISNLSINQIALAINYCKYGYKPESLEFALKNREEKSTDDIIDFDEEDWNECIAIGILHDAQALPLGCSLAELKEMTREELIIMTKRAYKIHGLKVDEKAEYELGEYYSTLDIIRDRLVDEKNKGLSNV